MDAMPPDAFTEPRTALLAALTLAAVAAAFQILLWARRAPERVKVRRRCPESQRMARVVYRLDGEGHATGVERCSLIASGKVPGCAMTCVRAPA